MASKPKPSREESSEPPVDGVPSSIPGTAQTGQMVRALQEAVRESISDLRHEVREMKASAHADHWKTLIAFGSGVAFLLAVFAWGYSRLDDRMESSSIRLETKIEQASNKADDRLITLNSTLVEIKTKLGDLLERIPPVQTPPPRR